MKNNTPLMYGCYVEEKRVICYVLRPPQAENELQPSDVGFGGDVSPGNGTPAIAVQVPDVGVGSHLTLFGQALLEQFPQITVPDALRHAALPLTDDGECCVCVLVPLFHC